MCVYYGLISSFLYSVRILTKDKQKYVRELKCLLPDPVKRTVGGRETEVEVMFSMRGVLTFLF